MTIGPQGNVPLQVWIANSGEVASSIGDTTNNGEILEGHIQRTGTWLGNPAAIYTIIGRREASGPVLFGTGITDIVPFPLATIPGSNVLTVPTLTGAENLELFCDNVNDTAAGTGVRTVRMTYLDSAGAVATRDITTNGGAVNIGVIGATAIWWINALTTGTNTVSVGNIDIRNVASPTTIYERISAGGNHSRSARFRVPTGWTGYLTFASAANGSNTVTQDVTIRAQVERGGRVRVNTFLFKNQFLLGLSETQNRPVPYIVIPGTADIKASTLSSATNQGRVLAEFTIIIRKDTP